MLEVCGGGWEWKGGVDVDRFVWVDARDWSP